MRVIAARNVNQLYRWGLDMLAEHGVRRESRAGTVIEMPDPVTSVYYNPTERVLFCPNRDANPFFHLMESVWMLAGRNDVAFPSQFVARMATFSDNSTTFHGAYGHRWSNHFLLRRSQLHIVRDLLRRDHDDRRVVLSMWDANTDLGHDGKDVPCNTHIYFKVKNGALDMTVCCRSNDIIWGCYGANAVHMSILHEWMALATEIPMGIYRQISDSYHAYVELFDKRVLDPWQADLYQQGVTTMPLLQVGEDPLLFLKECEVFIEDPGNTKIDSAWIKYVARPMYIAWLQYKAKQMDNALQFAGEVMAKDWRMAATAWLKRRVK